MVVEGPVSEVDPPIARVGGSRRPVTEMVDFGPLTIAFDERVLRPRPWTALQSEWAAELLPDLPSGPVLELCAGAGHIGLLAVRGSGRRLVQVDASEVACRFARLNAERAGLDLAYVEVRHGGMDDVVAAGERFALVVADPPWVRSEATCGYPADPLTAIDGGDDGLDLARRCVDLAAEHLLPGGRCVLQVGDACQVRAVEEYVGQRSAPGKGAPGLTVLEHRLAEGGALVLLGSPG